MTGERRSFAWCCFQLENHRYITSTPAPPKCNSLSRFTRRCKKTHTAFAGDQICVSQPVLSLGKIVETWDSLLQMQKAGKIRAVGVSNFGVKHLEALQKFNRPMPVVNQIEMHPMNYQDPGRAAREKQQARMRAFSPCHFLASRMEDGLGWPIWTAFCSSRAPLRLDLREERVPLLDFCKLHGILVQAYGSMFFGRLAQ